MHDFRRVVIKLSNSPRSLAAVKTQAVGATWGSRSDRSLRTHFTYGGFTMFVSFRRSLTTLAVAAAMTVAAGSAQAATDITGAGSSFVYPVLEKVDILSLELLTIDVQTPEVYTSKGVPVKVDGVDSVQHGTETEVFNQTGYANFL